MAKKEKSFSVKIDDEISEAFSKQVVERGYTKYRAIEGALLAFMTMPRETQVALMENNQKSLDILLNAFRDMALEVDLQKLSPVQRTQILALVKEVSAKVSQKR